MNCQVNVATRLVSLDSRSKLMEKMLIPFRHNWLARETFNIRDLKVESSSLSSGVSVLFARCPLPFCALYVKMSTLILHLARVVTHFRLLGHQQRCRGRMNLHVLPILKVSKHVSMNLGSVEHCLS